MFTGRDPKLHNDTEAVGRLMAAGLLEPRRDGLGTTERWQEVMLRALRAHPEAPIRSTLGVTLSSAFPDAADDEVGVMTRVMLLIEAREAGCRE